jgi:hypothetical protein
MAGRGLLVFCLLALFAAPARAATDQFQSALWTVDISTIADRAPAGNYQAFDTRNHLTYVVPGSDLGQSAWQAWDSGPYLLQRWFAVIDGARHGLDDRIGAYSLATSSVTEVKVTCNPGTATFVGSGSGQAGVRAAFTDLPIFGFGTGYSKAAAALKAEGDLSYPSPAEGTGAIAVASGDSPSELKATIPIPGLGLEITPKISDGMVSTSATGVDKKTVMKQTWQTTFRSYVTSDVKDDDSRVGYAESKGQGYVLHKLTLDGSKCTQISELGKQTSTIDIKFSSKNDGPDNLARWRATIHVVTTDSHGDTTEDKQVILWDPGHDYDAQSGLQRPIDRYWGPPGADWVPAPESPPSADAAQARPAAADGRLAASVGSATTYKVSGQLMASVSRLELTVTRANPITGGLTFAASATSPTGKTVNFSFMSNVFRGTGGPRGLVIPVGLRTGAGLYGLGRVSDVDSQRVVVRYLRGDAVATATYDARTGWLRSYTETYFGRTLSLQAQQPTR